MKAYPGRTLWRRALLQLGALLGLGWLAGLLLGLGWLLVAGVLLAYLAWSGYQLYRLEYWLLTGSYANRVPEGIGVWGEVFERLHRLEVRRQQRQRRLMLRLDQFRNSAHALPEAVVMLDKEFQIQWLNDAAGRLLGLDYARDIGQRVDNLLRQPPFCAYLHAGQFAEPLALGPESGSEQHLLLRIVPYGSNQLLLVAYDVTERHQVEQLRRDFVANVSHELRTPLTVFTGYLETLVRSDDPQLERWRRPIGLMQAQAERMQRIVTDLLLLARLESKLRAPMQPVPVLELLRSLRQEAQALSGMAQHQIVLYALADYGLQGNREELRSVFGNLLFNAVQYTPPGGLIAVHWWVDAQGGHLTVQDTGIGIAADHLPRLTERFYRVDSGRSRAIGGTGLGLAIVKHVLEHYRAPLRISSELGQGSCFSCDFPKGALVEWETDIEVVTELSSDSP